MKYILLIYQGASPTPRSPEEWERLSEDEKNAVAAAYEAVNAAPGVSPGLVLHPAETATTVWVEDGETLTTDGPFAGPEQKALDGYLLYEADDPGDAIELASRIPAARMGGAVEVRRVVER